MPIANCVVSETCHKRVDASESLIDLWARESGKSPDHMTVNFMKRLDQVGNEYEVMATLLLPSLWSGHDIDLLQTGLARALAEHFDIDLGTIHVITHIVQSGMVVEHGELVTW